MPQKANPRQVFDGQDQFQGGMNNVNPGPTQFYYGKNWVIRDGHLTTRPGIRRAFPQSGFREAFFFNPNNDRVDHDPPDGFWFPFEFATNVWSDVQGFGTVMLPTDNREVMLVVQSGNVYRSDVGFVTQIPTVDAISSDEKIRFTQFNNKVIMWRGEGTSDRPLVWDGSSAGFVAVAAPVTGSAIPNSKDGVFQMGRLWAYRDRSTVGASDSLDESNWDLTFSTFSITPGDNDEIVRLFKFQEDKILVFKRHSVSELAGIDSATLSNTITRRTADVNHGAVGPDAVTSYGQRVAYIGFKGIYDLYRNEQNFMQGFDVPMSWPIQNLIDRINWNDDTAIRGCQAMNYDNYLLFAVPIDGATRNNAILVYDTIANGGQGAWCGLWQSGQTKVWRFFQLRDQAYFMGYDGVPRQMFTNNPWDSENVLDDTPAYEADIVYEPGSYVNYPVGDERIYRADRTTKGNLPTDSDYWTQITNIGGLYDIESEVITRQIRHEDWASKVLARGELVFKHQDPKVDLFIRADDYETEEELYSDQEYSQLEYDIVKDDWDSSNINLDFRDPHRKDYANFYRSLDKSTAVLWDSIVVNEIMGPSYRVTVNYSGLTPGQRYGIFFTFQGGTESPGILDTVAQSEVSDTNMDYENGRWWITPSGATLAVTYIVAGVLYPQETAGIMVSNLTSSDKMTIIMDETGIDLEVWEAHNLRFIKHLVNDRSFALRVVNKRGKLSIRNFAVAAHVGPHAYKKR